MNHPAKIVRSTFQQKTTFGNKVWISLGRVKRSQFRRRTLCTPGCIITKCFWYLWCGSLFGHHKGLRNWTSNIFDVTKIDETMIWISAFRCVRVCPCILIEVIYHVRNPRRWSLAIINISIYFHGEHQSYLFHEFQTKNLPEMCTLLSGCDEYVFILPADWALNSVVNNTSYYFEILTSRSRDPATSVAYLNLTLLNQTKTLKWPLNGQHHCPLWQSKTVYVGSFRSKLIGQLSPVSQACYVWSSI